jgi:cytochrome P450
VLVSKLTIPPHVPPQLVWAQSLEDFSLQLDDPYRAVSRLHAGPDIVFSTYGYRGTPAWLPTRYALIEEVFLDHRRFASGLHSDISGLLGVDWQLIPLETDPPEHTTYRKILQPWFTPVAINKLEQGVRATCRALISRFETHGGCEFNSEFAAPFPAHIFLTLMGMPLERAGEFLEWATLWMRGETPEARIDGARQIMRYLERFIAERRANPQDDLTSAIVTAKIDGRPLTEDEVLATCYLLYLGGLDTVQSSLGWAMKHLAHDQQLQQRLRARPEDIPRAVNEFLRAHGVTTTRRTATMDIDFHGVQFKAGDAIVMSTQLAGRDPRQFEDPHAINIDRNGRHMSFAMGAHSCIGFHLARREIKIVLEELLSRFNNLRVPEGATVSMHTTGVWGVNKLPLIWDRIS